VGTGLFGRLQQELEDREKAAGLTMADVLTLPDQLRRLVNWMMRQGEVGLTDVAGFLGLNETDTRSTVATLLEKGFVRELQIRGETRYRIRLAPKRGREIPLNIWQALDKKTD